MPAGSMGIVASSINYENQARVSGNGNYISTPDSAALECPTDLTADWYGSIDTVGSTAGSLMHKFSAVTGGRSWYFRKQNANANIEGYTSSDGTNQFTVIQTTSAAVQMATNIGIRFTRRKSDGLVNVYQSLTDPPTWTLIGTATNNPGVGQADTTAPLIVMGGHTSGSTASPVGYFRRAELRNGFEGAGTLIASPDVTKLPIGTTSFVDEQGNTWTMNGSCPLSSRPAPPH